jgi:hypothetical protein
LAEVAGAQELEGGELYAAAMAAAATVGAKKKEMNRTLRLVFIALSP